MSNALAIFGGTPVTTKNFLVYNTIGDDEKRAVMEVLDSGNLSCFVANGSDAFYGGPKVRQLERAWAQFFGVKHAVSMNSATSGLYAAVAACSIGPGDEVILSPLTMCATGTAILLNGATPVFCDVDPLTMNMDPNRIEDCVTSKTKAIFVVHLGGHPCDMDPIIGIARKYQLRVLGDNAQAPGACYHGAFCGSHEDISVFSLNCHKTIQSGEGGVCVTDDDELALRLQLIRNHGEKTAELLGRADIELYGLNLRMTEMEAAVAIHQLAKLEVLTAHKQGLASYLTKRIDDEFDFMDPPYVQQNCTHAYYIYHLTYHQDRIGLPIDLFAKAVTAEGIPLYAHYGQPIYNLPVYKGKYDGSCPIAERHHESSLFLYELHRHPQTDTDMELFVEAVKKVLTHKQLVLAHG